MPPSVGCGYPRPAMKRTRTYNLLFCLLATISLLVIDTVAVAQSSGPRTPSASGSSPLLGYIIAVVLGALLVVVTMIPSKRHTEDI